MIESRVNTALVGLFMLVLVMVLSVTTAMARSDERQNTTVSSQEMQAGSGAGDPEHGVITRAPHLDSVNKELRIFINNTPYVLTQETIVIETGINEAYSRYDRVVSREALMEGQRVWVECLSKNRKTISRITIDLLPHGD
jgi:hypothetical protein